MTIGKRKATGNKSGAYNGASGLFPQGRHKSIENSIRGFDLAQRPNDRGSEKRRQETEKMSGQSGAQNRGGECGICEPEKEGGERDGKAQERIHHGRGYGVKRVCKEWKKALLTFRGRYKGRGKEVT